MDRTDGSLRSKMRGCITNVLIYVNQFSLWLVVINELGHRTHGVTILVHWFHNHKTDFIWIYGRSNIIILFYLKNQIIFPLIFASDWGGLCLGGSDFLIISITFFKDNQSTKFLRKVCTPISLCWYDNTARYCLRNSIVLRRWDWSEASILHSAWLCQNKIVPTFTKSWVHLFTWFVCILKFVVNKCFVFTHVVKIIFLRLNDIDSVKICESTTFIILDCNYLSICLKSFVWDYFDLTRYYTGFVTQKGRHFMFIFKFLGDYHSS